MNTPIFYIALFVHLVSLVVAFGSVIAMDVIGLLWTLKKVSVQFFNQAASIFGKLIWFGWTGLVLSGLFLITQKGYIDNLTWIKIFFVAMVAVNGYVLHRIGKVIRNLGDTPLSLKMKFRMTIASLVSQIGWWGAIVIGFVHRHIEHNILWPQSPLLFIATFCLILMAVVAAGELVLKNK